MPSIPKSRAAGGFCRESCHRTGSGRGVGQGVKGGGPFAEKNDAGVPRDGFQSPWSTFRNDLQEWPGSGWTGRTVDKMLSYRLADLFSHNSLRPRNSRTDNDTGATTQALELT